MRQAGTSGLPTTPNHLVISVQLEELFADDDGNIVELKLATQVAGSRVAFALQPYDFEAWCNKAPATRGV